MPEGYPTGITVQELQQGAVQPLPQPLPLPLPQQGGLQPQAQPVAQPQRWCLVVRRPGRLTSLGVARLDMPQQLQPWEVEVEVAAFALNFK